MENRQIAERVIELVGGKENIKRVAHCATRLRVIVVDQEKIDTKAIEELDKVKGSFYNSGQYQIIFGTGLVNQIHDEVQQLLGGQEQAASGDGEEKEKFTVQKALRIFGDVFVPIIPAIVAAGLFSGMKSLLTQPQILSLMGMESGLPGNLLTYIDILTGTAFTFLPVLVCWSAFKIFGGSPVLGIVLGLMLVNPSLPNANAVARGDIEALKFFGIIPVLGYQGSVLPAFIMGLIGAKLEKKLKKVIPHSLDLLVTPFAVLLFSLTLALLAIGPVFHQVEQGVLHLFRFLLGLPYGLSGICIGALSQVLVITGVHHIFSFLQIQLLAEIGKNPFNAINSCTIAAQAGACLAVALKTKKAKTKTLAYSSCLSAVLGITEPAIFGVNLRYIRVFVCGLAGGAAGGFIASIFGVAGTGLGITVIPGTLLYLGKQLPMYILSNIAGFAVAFALAYMVGFKSELYDVD